ncbi:hypothetical protein F443_09134 [Phytophthora nicotianae P1569]|uniref:BZIP domain-containing protein n=1 Tax=Phytophthora nicotianae P1569 TaxID=1317065 RepID=V9F7X8_PHYNI|nr:hypothetical protein F443_09134 [Phytophthora nicotianae P1569]
MTNPGREVDKSLNSLNGMDRKGKPKKRTVTQQQKLINHRINMVEFRIRKKEQFERLKKEHERLEREMKRLLAGLQNDFSHESLWVYFGEQNMVRSMVELIVEKEKLRKQNVARRTDVQRYDAFRKEVMNAVRLLSNEESLIHNDGGLIVPDKEPTFDYHPLSIEEVNAVPYPLDKEFMSNLPPVSFIGAILGWNVYREESNLTASLPSTRVQLTKRLHCSIAAATQVSLEQGDNLRPLLATPIGWSVACRPKVSTHVLQEVNAECCVMAHTFPGPLTCHYVFLERVAQWELPDGRKKLGLSMNVIDSTVSRLSSTDVRTHEPNPIKWAKEGWASVTITEVDATTVDVVYDQWARCESKLHADYVVAQWAQFLVRWEQIVAPFRFLTR